MAALDNKINEFFSGLVVRKDLVKTVKGNANVPTYVLEYLLGQYCATSDEASILSGVETVKEVLRKHFVHRNESGLIKSAIKEKGRLKVIDKVSVVLNEKDDNYQATFTNLGISKIIINNDTIKDHQKLLVSGVWCISELEYVHTEERDRSPWVLASLKPIQLSQFNYEGYIAARKKFTTDEWIDLLIQSIGFNPEMFGKRNKLMQLIRLIPFCERNYNLIELGPKGTGKSHVYSEFSPHGMLISGGEVTVAKLFVNNSTGKIGLVGYWDVVAFDEFAGKTKKVDKALVDIMKNYMANKTFSRGVETLGADASIAFVGNTQHNLPYMLKHSDLFDELPDKYHDSAFIDRIHFYIPGWEVDIIRGEMYSDGYGFVVDYLAEILRAMRNQDFSQLYTKHFTLSSKLSTRDRDAINKTFSGLMKILYPQGEATTDQIEEVLRFAIEGRKRVKDQLFRIDDTYDETNFSYKNAGGKEIFVKTLEEEQYPEYYQSSKKQKTGDESQMPVESNISTMSPELVEPKIKNLKEGQIVYQENQRGVTYDQLFGPYIKGATNIVITDPYLRVFFQIRNMMEFLETIAKFKAPEDEVLVHLITSPDEFKKAQQEEFFETMKQTCEPLGIKFTWFFDDTNSIHARHITTNTGWKILLDRGLDIFQQYDMNNAFAIANRMQQFRSCKAFEITYLKSRL